MTKLSLPQQIEIARAEMNRAVWSYLNAILPPHLTDDDIDTARDTFVAAGLDAVDGEFARLNFEQAEES